ncbi:acetamidase/formamidase family protein [Ancylobacter sp. MQZ15Z-1]|uniref:Acetamidase/formamidase family protein n=1 Tax=Ancylobacter mangrovi TaxID=2972472 RepID=A0A9X2PFN5_9HYPH|nr:acetamidase/formamidase family protein [Ancylobacter mangrovi]MCS0496504.1 acetamidase/formamidase family protein [Ancylobacter mangrovi]
MKHLDATPSTVHFGFHDACLPPVMEVNPGEEIVISSVSADPDDAVPAHWLPVGIADIYAHAPRGTGPHILTGPVHVRGAIPGDTLVVDILDIRLTQPYGYNIVSPMKGMFPQEQPTQRTTVMPIDLDTGLVEVASGIRIPTRPFFGQLLVAPPPEWGRLDSRPPNRHGGNLDNKELVKGTRLLLPVWNEGALFSAGDGHAAQGDGEINQTAIETSMEGRFRLSLLKGRSVEWPVAVTPTHLLAMAFHEDLDDAARLAMRALIALMEEGGLSFHNAYRLGSVAADLRITQFVNGNRGVHAMLPIEIARALPRPPDFLPAPGELS